MRTRVPLVALAVCACAPADDAPLGEVFADASRWVDLTHPFDSTTIYWPTAERFALEVVAAGMTEAGYWYEANGFRAAEHGGTHLDAPVHFAEGRHSADEIPLARLTGPAVVVDVSQASAADADYQVTVADLEAFEAAHGVIPEGAILLIRTGWSARWSDPERYLGTAARGADAVADLHFPGVHPDAARWLVANRTIDAIGIDTPSIDYGQSTAYETHRVLYGENVPGFENVAALDRLPATGAYVIALPMKIAGGSGGPLRIVAVVP